MFWIIKKRYYRFKRFQITKRNIKRKYNSNKIFNP